MIAKLTKGTGFRGVLAYLLEGKKGEPREHALIIGSNMASESPRRLAQEFGVLRRLRPAVGRAVCHASISLAPEDRKLTNDEFSFIAKRFLAGMGYDDCPFIVVRHEDTAHQHIHVLVSRITAGGGVVADGHDYQRAEKIMRELEQVYLLRSPADLPATRKATHDAVNKPNHKGNEMKNEIKHAVEEAIKESSDFKQFISGCKARGVQPTVHLSGKRVCGFAFRKGPLRVKGSELGRTFSWDAIRQRLDYQEAQDFPVLEELCRHDREAIQSATCPDYVDQKGRREQARQLLDDDYIQALRTKFGDSLVELHRENSMIELCFKNGGVVRDYGDRVVVDDADPQQAAARIIAMAVTKGWEAISFTGQPDFIRAAMRAALVAGLRIVAKDEEQEKLLIEIKAEGSMATGAAMEPKQIAGIRKRIDTLRTLYKAPEPAVQPRPRHFKL